MDGTLLQAWAYPASLERFDGEDDPRPRPSAPGEGYGPPKSGKKRAKGNLRGIQLSDQTHRSSTDPDDSGPIKGPSQTAFPPVPDWDFLEAYCT